MRSGRWNWAVFVGLTLVTTGAWACPFCSGPSQTLAERYADSQVVLVTRCVPESPDPAAAKELSPRYEIVQVLRDTSSQFKVGQTLEQDRTAAPGTRTLFLGNFDTKTSRKPTWTELVDVNNVVLKYIQDAPAPKQPGRLKYFAPFLEHPEIVISNDAYGEFANAKYEEILPVAREMSPERIRGWLNNPRTLRMRFGLLGMLLGLCGTQEDATLLGKLALSTDDAAGSGLDGITYGYLLLRGERGLEDLSREVLQNPSVTDGVVNDRLHAIRCVWTYGEGRIPRELLCRSLRPLLKRKGLTELVVADLARWKDWSVQDEIVAMYGAESLKKATVLAYLVASMNDAPPKPTEVPPHAVSARRHLERLLQKDPTIVKTLSPQLIKALPVLPATTAEKPANTLR